MLCRTVLVNCKSIRVAEWILNPRTEPENIYFLDENGDVRKSTFTEFIVNGTCNEVGNMGYHNDALKANAMAVKMVGWYCVWAGYFISEGYDIPFGWVACMSYYQTNEQNTQIANTAHQEPHARPSRAIVPLK